VPGITDRDLGRLMRAIFIAFEDAVRFFPARKIERLGNFAAFHAVLRFPTGADGGSRRLNFLYSSTMAPFESYERRIAQITPVLAKYGIASLEEAHR
jgi:hypothetical protein